MEDNVDMKRFLRVKLEADRIFGRPELASKWLSRPNGALQAKAPQALLVDEAGETAVMEMQGQIDHGMFR